MFDQLLARIRKHTRKEWVGLLNENLTNTRIWIQENGEKAALLALVVGVLLVAVFKLIFTLLIVAILVFGVVWFLAPEEHGSQVSSSPDGTNGVDSSGNGPTH